MAALPGEITRAPLRTFRPQDLAEVYSQPSVQLHRLVRDPRVRKAAHGLYYTVPDDQDPAWMPTLEAVAAGVATAIFGERVPVLMHLTAARLLGALPRAIGQAVVAVPRQHAPLRLTDRPAATVTFVARDVDGLDAALRPTDLGPALVTTPEQTVLDLTRRPELGGMPEECRAATRVLLPRCDPGRLEEIARAQRMVRTLERLRAENA
ncbi:type IV toxin-antitoxin system AbiEi family antitoxin domain-containing protein [Geodermatophilus sp. SYSU D00815]